MIDYLLAFPTDEDRRATFPPPDDAPDAPCWGAIGGTVMPVEVTPGVHSWAVVRCMERVPGIEALANCMIATNSDLAAAGEAYVYFCRLAPKTIIGQVSPVFAGDAYVIPAGQPASVLDQWLIA